MSYCRWSNSCWYIFLHTDSDETKDGQILAIEDRGKYSYKELKNDYSHILIEVRNARFERNPRNYKGEGHAPSDRYTEEEIQELKGYIDKFIKDVEFRFDPENIKKYGDIINLVGG